MTAAFDLPLPPPLNNMYINSARGGRYKSPRAKKWTTDAGWVLKVHGVQKIASPKFGVAIYLPLKMQGDIDGRAKPILDLLVQHKITPDDRHAVWLTIERSAEVPVGACRVRIVEVPA